MMFSPLLKHIAVSKAESLCAEGSDRFRDRDGGASIEVLKLRLRSDPMEA